jgi:tetratricopeptide (TPR) repeat protein
MGLSGQPVKRGTMAHEHIIYMMLVDSAAAAGDREMILKYAPSLEKLARRDEHRPYLGVAYRAYGVAHRLGEDFEQAEACLLQALTVFEEMGIRWQYGRTLFELGELANLRGEPELSRERLTLALEAFEALKAEPDATRTRAGLDRVITIL